MEAISVIILPFIVNLPSVLDPQKKSRVCGKSLQYTYFNHEWNLPEIKALLIKSLLFWRIINLFVYSYEERVLPLEQES